MRKQNFIRLVACVALAAVPVMIPTIAAGQAPVPPAAAPAPPAPQMPPSLVPVLVVNLMTPEGSAVFGAQWKTMEAKIIPAKIGDFDTSGATAVLTAYVDDYAEVWVNGQMARRAGYPSPATIQGFNMPNRVLLADAVKPGEKFQIAIFGVNGPISVAPMNFVWFREAKIEFFR